MKCPGGLGTAGKVINDRLFGLSLCLHLFQRNCCVGVELLQLNSSISLLCILSGLLISSCWFLPSQPWLNAKHSKHLCCWRGPATGVGAGPGASQACQPQQGTAAGWGPLGDPVCISSHLFLTCGSSGTSQFLFSSSGVPFVSSAHTLSVFLRTCWKLGWVLIPSEF